MKTSGRVEYVLVCEDTQQESFVRKFLKAAKRIHPRQLRIVMLEVEGKGAATQFVLNTYPTELKAIRRTHAAKALLILIDGDAVGVSKRLRQLDEECERQGVKARSPKDNVAVFIPTWEIETWLEYLDGQRVDESRKDYPRLKHQGDCQRHVKVLVEMCRRRKLRQPAPESLLAACKEYDERLR